MKRDRVEKKALYEKVQVPHYWLIDPRNKNLEIYNLVDDKYVLEDIYTKYDDCERERLSQEDKLHIVTEFKTAAFEELTLDINEIFTMF